MEETFESTRRAILSAVGGLAVGTVASGRGAALRRNESGYVLVQGGECVSIEPIRGDRPVEEFYDYQLPVKYASDANGASVGDTAKYASAGTQDLQRTATTITFLYLGPEGLSLVVLHGDTRTTDGGAVTFRISGLPSDGDWVVKDDLYRDPDTDEPASTNFDRWQVEGTEHRIDWTWGSSGTDGGAFRDLGEEFEVVVRPAFNEDSPLYGEHYEGTITDWEFLTGVDGTGERVSLDLSEPIRVETGTCEGGGDGGEHSDAEQGEEQGHEREEEQEANQAQEHETEGHEEEREEEEREHETEEKTEEREHETEEKAEQGQEHEEEQEKEEEERERKEEQKEEERERKEEQKEEERERKEEQKEEEQERKEEQKEEEEESRGKGHEKSTGKGHDKHGDDDDDEDDDD